MVAILLLTTHASCEKDNVEEDLGTRTYTYSRVRKQIGESTFICSSVNGAYLNSIRHGRNSTFELGWPKKYVSVMTQDLMKL